MPSRKVSIAKRHPHVRVDRRAVTRAIHALDAQHATLATAGSMLGNSHELSVAFVTDAELAKLHANFLGDPSRTDVITFAGNPALGSAGEICVSMDTAKRYAEKHGCDYSEEVTLYLIHGWLHLAGYDDLTPAEKRRMRRAERRALTLLRASASIPKFILHDRDS